MVKSCSWSCILELRQQQQQQHFYSNYSGRRKRARKKTKQKKKVLKTNSWRYIIIYTIFELVCNSQSSKAFKLAAAYLQLKKKEQRKQIIIKTKLIHKARSIMKIEWRCCIKKLFTEK